MQKLKHRTWLCNNEICITYKSLHILKTSALLRKWRPCQVSEYLTMYQLREIGPQLLEKKKKKKRFFIYLILCFLSGQANTCKSLKDFAVEYVHCTRFLNPKARRHSNLICYPALD